LLRHVKAEATLPQAGRVHRAAAIDGGPRSGRGFDCRAAAATFVVRSFFVYKLSPKTHP
jgi:hypothetical protein